MSLPMQPIERDENGTIRFRMNKIVRLLLDTGVYDLNSLSVIGYMFSSDEWSQFYQHSELRQF